MKIELSKSKAAGKITDEMLMEYLGSDFWILNKPLAQKLGILTALWLTHIIQKYKYFKKNDMLDEEGYFYNVQKYIEEETTINSNKQTEIISKLKGLDILDVKKKGLPARNYYKVRTGNLIDLITSGTSDLKTQELDSEISETINKDKIRNKDERETPKIRILGVQASPEQPSSNKPTLLKRPTKKKNSEIIRTKYRNNKVTLPKKETKPITVPKSIQDIIDYWNSSGLRQHKDPTTKIYKEIVKRTKQILRNKFEVNGYKDKEITPEKIKLSIAHLKIAATNPSYEPVSSESKDYLRGISLSDFFYNSHAIRNKSLMLYYLEPPLPLKDPLVANDHPYVTEEFKEQYVKYVLGGVHSEEFSNREENCFRKASKLMLEFFDKNGDRIDLTPLEQKYPNNLVRYVFAALDKQINEDWTKVTPGWFSQPSLYSKTLPAYLYNQAIIEEPIND